MRYTLTNNTFTEIFFFPLWILFLFSFVFSREYTIKIVSTDSVFQWRETKTYATILWESEQYKPSHYETFKDLKKEINYLDSVILFYFCFVLVLKLWFCSYYFYKYIFSWFNKIMFLYEWLTTLKLISYFDTRWSFELAFSCNRFEINQYTISKIMLVLLKSGSPDS